MEEITISLRHNQKIKNQEQGERIMKMQVNQVLAGREIERVNKKQILFLIQPILQPKKDSILLLTYNKTATNNYHLYLINNLHTKTYQLL